MQKNVLRMVFSLQFLSRGVNFGAALCEFVDIVVHNILSSSINVRTKRGIYKNWRQPDVFYLETVQKLGKSDGAF